MQEVNRRYSPKILIFKIDTLDNETWNCCETGKELNTCCGLHGSRKFCQRGPTLTPFVLLDEGRDDPNDSISGRLNGVSLACRCWPNIACWLGSFVIDQGFRTSIGRNLCLALWFSGWGTWPSVPLSGSVHGIKHAFGTDKGVLSSVPTHRFSSNFAY